MCLEKKGKKREGRREECPGQAGTKGPLSLLRTGCGLGAGSTGRGGQEVPAGRISTVR